MQYDITNNLFLVASRSSSQDVEDMVKGRGWCLDAGNGYGAIVLRSGMGFVYGTAEGGWRSVNFEIGAGKGGRGGGGVKECKVRMDEVGSDDLRTPSIATNIVCARTLV